MTIPLDVLLVERQRRAVGNCDLFAHQIDSGNQFSNRMLNLETRVHLQEIEFARGVGDQKLYRACADVINSSREFDRRLAHLFAQRRVVYWRRTLFNHFLMTALNRTFAFAQMDHVAVRVGEYLNLDMPRPLDRFFEIERIVTKCRRRFRLRVFES